MPSTIDPQHQMEQTFPARPPSLPRGRKRTSDAASVQMNYKRSRRTAQETRRDESNGGFSRPPLPKNPPIWAQSRQELCESCDFFKAYQAGVYYRGGQAKGYLLSCHGALRDVWHDGGRLIISHGGGKAGSELLKADHQLFEDHSVTALVNNWRAGEPLVLIADDRYEYFPFDLTKRREGGTGYGYVVLGYYIVRHYWAEKHPEDNEEGYAVRFKFAFQYCQEGDPWWIEFLSETLSYPLETDCRSVTGKKLSIQEADVPTGSQSIQERTCHCAETSPKIYVQGWMCLWPRCERHFQLDDGRDATTMTLAYASSFLAVRLDSRKKPTVRIYKPVSQAKNGIVTTPIFYHGWLCQVCGRLSCRNKWEQWECASCGLVVPVEGGVRDHREFRGLSPSVSFEKCYVNPSSGITKLVSIEDQLQRFTFILPRNRGKIHLISGGDKLNVKANELFKRFQECASNGTLQLRRFPMKTHVCRGAFLTNYFSHNSGKAYRYVGGADGTLPLENCPTCVPEALALIQARAAMVLSEEPPFNELLTVAYMEKQSMGFHTDGEQGLGPVVASLSMGSPAIMKFRTMEGKTVVLTLVLRHGDVTFMEGATIQALYEHSVCPDGFRIAVTARNVCEANAAQGAWR